MYHKVMCPSKHMKIILLNLQDQYKREQLYGKEREEKRRGSWRKEKLYPLPPSETVRRVNHSSFTNLGCLQMKPDSTRMLKDLLLPNSRRQPISTMSPMPSGIYFHISKLFCFFLIYLRHQNFRSKNFLS